MVEMGRSILQKKVNNLDDIRWVTLPERASLEVWQILSLNSVINSFIYLFLVSICAGWGFTCHHSHLYLTSTCTPCLQPARWASARSFVMGLSLIGSSQWVLTLAMDTGVYLQNNCMFILISVMWMIEYLKHLDQFTEWVFVEMLHIFWKKQI